MYMINKCQIVVFDKRNVRLSEAVCRYIDIRMKKYKNNNMFTT